MSSTQASGTAPALRSLPLSHALLALAVVAVWGTNFVVIHVALEALPPLALATMRFALAFLPAALFIRRPAVPWRLLAVYGLLIGCGQFGLLYIALQGLIAPGLASLVVQTQVFFTIGLVLLLERRREGALSAERLQAHQWLALALAVAGLVMIGLRSQAAGASALGIVLVLAAALAWAGGNVASRRMGRADMLGVVVWSSAFAVLPLAALSLALEGPAAIASRLSTAGPLHAAAVLWQALGNTLFGYAAWGWLLARHPAATITPWALGVPVFGLASAAAVLGEPMPAWKLVACTLVIAGLALHVLGPRWQRSQRA
jgi:O-acetylserine/cysteine efflux transporter